MRGCAAEHSPHQGRLHEPPRRSRFPRRQDRRRPDRREDRGDRRLRWLPLHHEAPHHRGRRGDHPVVLRLQPPRRRWRQLRGLAGRGGQRRTGPRLRDRPGGHPGGHAGRQPGLIPPTTEAPASPGSLPLPNGR